MRYQQILGQLRNRFRQRYEKMEEFNFGSIPSFPGCCWHHTSPFLPPGPQNNCAVDILRGRLSFLNNVQDIGWPPKWDNQALPKLWQYNLHYFDYLWALEWPHAKAVVLDWINHHKIQKDHIGWEPYPTALRLMNWCTFFFAEHRKHTQADGDFIRNLWQSIFIQTEWLTKHLETHLLGNHLFENGAALALAGSCFSGSKAINWFKLGKGILANQLPEQILPDGLHYERSGMYHSRLIYVLCLLLNTQNAELRHLISDPLKKMLRSLKHIVHPDTNISLFNDSAFGIYNHPEQLICYSTRLLGDISVAPNHWWGGAAVGLFALPDAGYYGARTEDGSYVICDAGPIGPDYIPGHAHADIFSFELSIKGHRVIVDSGVHDYEIGPTRDYCRSTKAHNTVQINGQDQCEMWGAFRVARRGRPHSIQWLPTEYGFQLGAWHDGYKRLKGRPIHHRQFNWHKSGGLSINDTITASCSQSAASRLHLHPDCSINKLKDSSASITYPAGEFEISFLGDGRLSVEDSLYCPEFGRKFETKSLVYCASGRDIKISFIITPQQRQVVSLPQKFRDTHYLVSPK